MNSYLRTSSGLSLLINGKSYTIDQDHHNYAMVVLLIASKDWSHIPDLINQVAAVANYIDRQTVPSDLTIDQISGTVLFRGDPLPPVITTSILKMFTDGFNVAPMSLFLNNLYENPSNKAIEQLFGWMTANGVTISDDGYLLAFKRVRDDFTSFYDGKTQHPLGGYVQMPRNKVDDRSDVTCSHGLHFCAQSYLPSYAGGAGNVLLLKINPADVVSIPIDYNFAKGRACKYQVLDVLRGDARTGVEERNVIPQPVVLPETDYNQSDAYKIGYRAGYKDGRGKQAKGKSLNLTGLAVSQYDDYNEGYDTGLGHGRKKQPNLYGGEVLAVERPEPPTSEYTRVFERVAPIFADMLGLLKSDVQPNKNIVADYGADSLDCVELVMAVEDEFGVEVTAEETETLLTVDAVVKFVLEAQTRR